MEISKQDALDYHRQGRRGKIQVVATKPCHTQWDLSLAYTPGVAFPCLEIKRDPSLAYEYTSRGNLVAVVTNGTRVLGLGNIGPLAGKPVMEGKAVLFKRLADIDVFDLEINAPKAEDVIKFCQLLEPTVGAINLEDIQAPDCFIIEEALRKDLQIPAFHDDQHGTAIIAGAALLNALEVVEKDAAEVRVVFSGAGAAGIATAKHFINLGVRRENIVMCDVHGVLYEDRQEGIHPYNRPFAVKTRLRTMVEALKDADVFVGLSTGGNVTPDMLKPMAERPIIFALANPDPEIPYPEARAARPDAVIATGRSDFPNQVNNVLGFPFIFRGALDVRARTINDEMTIAATRSLAALAKEDVPDSVLRAYGGARLKFGAEYIIPKPFDPRVLIWESASVAEAAMTSGVAQVQIDIEEYRDELSRRLGRTYEVMQSVRHKARTAPKRIVFSEGEHDKILRASYRLAGECIAHPILLGRRAVIEAKLEELNLGKLQADIVDPDDSPKLESYTEEFFRIRQRRGVTRSEAQELLLNHNYYGSMMVRMGDADGFIAGVAQHYPETIRPALQVIGMREGVHRVSGLYVLATKKDVYFFADTTVNIDPSADELAEIAILAAEEAREFNIEPRVAMLSFSNFGSTKHPLTEKVRRAAELVRRKEPGLMVDGEMQADTAVVPEIVENDYPFAALRGGANVLVFPDLEAGNIAYKLMMRIGGAEALGPILMGMARPVYVLQRGAEVEEIVNMAAIAVMHAQSDQPQLRLRI